VYLPYFLEHLVDRNPQLVPALTAIVRSRLIDFRPDARPSIANPFPQPIDVNKTVTGTVDSLSTQRMNLLQSADFFELHSSGGPVSIRMDITGLGPGNDPNANDLDLFLYSLDDRLIAFSDRGLNGQSELVPVVLAEGTYVVEVRSNYDRGETNKGVFNS